MSLQMQHLEEKMWIVTMGETPVAEIYLDYCNQINEVVIYDTSSTENRLSVLRLVASHVQQFVINREAPTFLGQALKTSHNNHRTGSAHSSKLMDFGFIPEKMNQLDMETIISELNRIRVDVIVAIHNTAQKAIEDAISQISVQSLRYKVIPRQTIFENELFVEFSVAKPHHFIFWKSELAPSHEDWDLHVIPPYHPVMNGWRSVGTVNGDTDAHIGKMTVRSIYCPRAAQSKKQGNVFGSSWNHVKHPFYAAGQSMSIKLITTKARSRNGVEELVQMLRGALGQKKLYVEISGGFNAPMKCAHNHLLELGRKSPWPKADSSGAGHVARGSEEHCVWAHRTLEAEGVLDKSYVPSWFIKEGWLEIYKDAPVEAGLY